MLLKNKLPHKQLVSASLQRERGEEKSRWIFTWFSFDFAVKIRDENEKTFCSIFSTGFLSDEENLLLSINVEAPPTKHDFYVVIVRCFKDFYDHFLNESSFKLFLQLNSVNLTWQLVIKTLSENLSQHRKEWGEKMFDVDLLENCHTCSHWSSQKKNCSRLWSEKTFFHFSRSH